MFVCTAARSIDMPARAEKPGGCFYLSTYIYIYIYIYELHTYIYIYIYRERERERDRYIYYIYASLGVNRDITGSSASDLYVVSSAS